MTGVNYNISTFKIHVPYLFTVGNRYLGRVLKKQDFITSYFIVIICIMGWPWDCSLGLGFDQLALIVLALLTSLILGAINAESGIFAKSLFIYSRPE